MTTLRTLSDHLDSPVRIAAATVAGVVAILVSLLVVRIVLRRPVVWLVLLAVAMPIRVPISFGGARDGNLLLPLYWVVAIGLVALAWGAARGRLDALLDRSTPLDIPIAAFTAFSLTSILWSGDIEEAHGQGGVLLHPVRAALPRRWWSGGRWSTSPSAPSPCRPRSRWPTGTAIVALGQYATRTIWWNDTLKQGNVYNRFFRANGIFFDPNILGPLPHGRPAGGRGLRRRRPAPPGSDRPRGCRGRARRRARRDVLPLQRARPDGRRSHCSRSAPSAGAGRCWSAPPRSS